MEKQQFRIMDFILLLSLTVGVGGICLQAYNQHEPHTQSENALRMAENISAQLLNLKWDHLQSLQKQDLNNHRQPSSKNQKKRKSRLGLVGKIGQDPWGNSYEYRFVETQIGKLSHLVVISMGPDEKMFHPISHWTADQLDQIENSEKKFRSGDDIGFVLNIATNSPTSH